MYKLSVTYGGYDQKLDNVIAKTVGRQSTGSGYCFIDGTRDLDFEFTRLYGLVNAQMRIKDKFRRKVKTKMYDKQDEEIHPNSKMVRGFH